MTFLRLQKNKQECIPVECVPSCSVTNIKYQYRGLAPFHRPPSISWDVHSQRLPYTETSSLYRDLIYRETPTPKEHGTRHRGPLTRPARQEVISYRDPQWTGVKSYIIVNHTDILVISFFSPLNTLIIVLNISWSVVSIPTELSATAMQNFQWNSMSSFASLTPRPSPRAQCERNRRRGG